MPEEKLTKISDINGDILELNIKAKILSISSKETETSKGKLIYHYGLLGDDTGVLPYTAWSIPSTVREKDVYEIRRCYSKTFKDKVRIYFDQKTEFKFLTENMEVKRSYRYYSIKDLNIRDKFVTVEGILKDERVRDYEKDGEKKKIYQYTLKDQTGSIGLSSFGMQLKTGKGVRLEGARLDEFNGYYRLNVSDKTGVEYITLQISEEPEFTYLRELKHPVGDVMISGFIISMGEKSGLISRCRECKKKVDDIRCPDHPESPLEYDIFVYFTVDDGTDYIQVSSGLEPLKKIIGIDETYLNNEKRPPLRKEVKDKLENSLMHNALVIRGNIRENTQGLSMKATEIRGLGKEDLAKINRIQEEEFL
ncbi:hypothetical protein ACNF42_02775 [Cuniculiplasma sp. SKW3]|uniref:hypothetical protein n=1 Tax=unclassified Cuniculiplasma TaxID=2619706 RepID=UPI003FD310E0